MVAKRPNIASAGADLAFAALALVAGLAGAAPLYAAAVFVGSVIVWGWTRRHALGRMAMQQRLTQGAIALVMLAAVIGVMYWIGLTFGGHT